MGEVKQQALARQNHPLCLLVINYLKMITMIKHVLILVCCSMISLFAFSQNPNPGQQLANHIANKMKDTLNLTIPERNNIYAINLNLYNQKQVARQLHSGPTLGSFLQAIEHTRDSLYNTVLPAAKYLLYKQKKSTLITSN